ncbi:2041_t:CDS:2 [Funneliformis geosporum]|uniref:2041_t:CDS:1 n=1 Tax=Funneliformis geosporum TaxID=1117311 RepID=A0A9W4WX48_9GLOM|nr:2041_t:CDS:2 [Funneliformis geosporum]
MSITSTSDSKSLSLKVLVITFCQYLNNQKDDPSFINCIRIGDLGLSKSAIEADDNETYGIIPYMAPEIFQGQKYTTASDIYSFGMIMWECMTGRRPFWDRAHDTELILDICDGLRPPIGNINAPEGYIELMKECWDPDQSKKLASGIIGRILDMPRACLISRVRQD